MGKAAFRQRAPGFVPFLDGIFMIVGMFAFAGAMIIVGNILGQVLSDTFLALIIDTPDFSYSFDGMTESGNPTFDVYQQMRLIAYALLGPTIIIGTAMSVVDARSGEKSLVTNSYFGRIVVKPVVLLIVLTAFPFLWDMSTEFTENVALWILNPDYSFDPDHPCPADWTDAETRQKYNDSKYIKGFPAEWVSHDQQQIVCRPDLKTNYLITQVVSNTELKDEVPEDILGMILDTLTGVLTTVYSTIMFAVPKALIAMQIGMMGVIVGVALDVFIAVTIAALPMFAILSMIPLTRGIANKFLMVLPAVLILPIISAVMLVVGAGFVASIPDQYENYQSGPLNSYLVHAWVASLGTVILVIMLPTMLIPFLNQTYQLIFSHVRTALQSAAVVTSFAAGAGKQAVGGAQSLMKGSSDGGGSGGASGAKDTLMSIFSKK